MDNSDDVRRPRLDDFAADTPFSPAGWRWFGERWTWTICETEVAQLLVIGREEKMIARDLGISLGAVHSFVVSLYNKTEVHSRSEFSNKLVKRCPA